MANGAEPSHATRIMVVVEGCGFDLGLVHMECFVPGARLRVVAVRGDANDWAAYAGPASWSEQMIREHGNKLLESDAARLFPILRADRYRR